MSEIWFWQRIVTPHMAGLAVSLARRGHDVRYVAESLMSDQRAQQGWSAPPVEGVRLLIVENSADVVRAVAEARSDSVHICQGIRANGRVGIAQRALRRRCLKQWVVMETVDDHGAMGVLKRIAYRCIFARWRNHIQGVLATGWRTESWVVRRGVPSEKVFPFAYFLSEPPVGTSLKREPGEFRFLFVGQFIELKRLKLLLDTLHVIARGGGSFELFVVGSGPLEAALRRHGNRLLGSRLQWLGRRPSNEVRKLMASVDCLVLPSRYDGWGAVVSEALMAGTPVIASVACGSAGVVVESRHGGVFGADEPQALEALLFKMLQSGAVAIDQRERLAQWAQGLGADAGASYLSQIIGYGELDGRRPHPPWVQTVRTSVA